MCTLLDMRFKFIRLWLNHIFSLKVGVLFHGQLNRIYLVYKGLIIPNLPLFNKINWISMKQVFSENMLSDFSDYLHEMKKCNFWDRPNWKKKKILSQNVQLGLVKAWYFKGHFTKNHLKLLYERQWKWETAIGNCHYAVKIMIYVSLECVHFN